MFKCGLRTLHPRAGIGEIGGIGCRDQGLLSPPSTGRRWLWVGVFTACSCNLLPSTDQLVERAGRDTAKPLFYQPVLPVGTGATEAPPLSPWR